MISSTRTSLILDDALVRRAKRRAVECDVTPSDVVNEALHDAPVVAAPFLMVTFGRPEGRVRHEPADFAAAAVDQDREELR